MTGKSENVWRVSFSRGIDAAFWPGFAAGWVLAAVIMPIYWGIPRDDRDIGWVVDFRLQAAILVVGLTLVLVTLSLFSPVVTRRPALRIDRHGLTAWKELQTAEVTWDEIESIGPPGTFLLIFDVLRVHMRDGRSIRLHAEYFGESEFDRLPKTIATYLERIGRTDVIVQTEKGKKSEKS